MGKNAIRRPDEAAMSRLLAEQKKTAAGLILRLAWRQGLTREEIQRLTWDDVSFPDHQLCLPDRAVPLDRETETCLRLRFERQGTVSPFVVISDRLRRQLPPESISRLARTALDQAGLGGISLMDLRHDFIIRQLEQHDWPYVARISGIAVNTPTPAFPAICRRGGGRRRGAGRRWTPSSCGSSCRRRAAPPWGWPCG